MAAIRNSKFLISNLSTIEEILKRIENEQKEKKE